jgi:hypothetical protein
MRMIDDEFNCRPSICEDPMLFRFTVRSADAPAKFDPSAFVLPFDDRLEAYDFAAELLKQYGVFGAGEHPTAINVSPVAYAAPPLVKSSRRLMPA